MIIRVVNCGVYEVDIYIERGGVDIHGKGVPISDTSTLV